MSTTATDAPEKIACTCSQCGAARQVKPTSTGIPRTPKGWKNKATGVVCSDCQKHAFRIRAVDFTIAGILDGGTWAEFLQACKASWSQAAAYKNTVMSMLWVRDYRRKTGDVKLPAMPPIGTGGVYRMVNESGQHAEIDSGTRASLARSTEAIYQSQRYELLWTMERSLSNFRYPQPYPIRKQETRIELGPDNEMLLSLRLGGRWWQIRLRGGNRMRSRTDDFRLLASGQATLDDVELIRTMESASNGGKTGTDHNPETGRKETIGVRVKIVGWFPRTPSTAGTGVLHVRTAADAFVIATHNDGLHDPWILHGQNITRAIARHRRWLVAQSDDRKFERRRPKRARSRYNAGTQARAFRHCEVAKSWLHESTRQVANLAIRQRVGIVKFERQVTNVESFPWHQWQAMLGEKLVSAGIVFVSDKEVASGPVPQETP